MKAELPYEGVVVRGRATSFDVQEKIDVSVVFGDAIETPTISSENKNMTINLGNTNPTKECARGLCQSAYNVLRCSQQLQENYEVIIPDLMGFLTNGIQWIFISLDTTEQIPLFSRTPVIDAVKSTKSSSVIDGESTSLVAVYLVKAFKDVQNAALIII